MRNLKRALSLLLSSTMVLGMMVMGGSAAGYQDVDASNDHQEAIEVLQAVGVMSGIDNEGNFDPDGSVTRNQMAVIMAHLLNLDYDYYRGTNPFTDVPEWAAPYVAACAAEGVIAGIGDNQFGGEMKVTAAQASLMIMKALGYFQNAEDFGDDWQIATIRQASYINLFDRVDSDAASALTRGQVAQLVLNGLKSDMVSFTGDKGVQIGDVTVGYHAEYTPKTSAEVKYNSIVGGRNDIADQGQYYIQLGEELYNGDLKLTNGSDDFERPSRVWSYDGKEIGTYAKKELMIASYTDGVTGKEMYDLLTSATINKSELDVYLDGADNSANVKKTQFVRSNDKDLNGTGDGVVTEVYLDNSAKQITMVSINTYLAKATSSYSENSESATLLVYESNDTGVTKTVDVDVVPEVVNVEKDAFYTVNMTRKYNNTNALEVASITEPTILADSTVTKWSKSDSGLVVSKLTTDGNEYKANVKAFYDDSTLDAYDMALLTDMSYNIYLDANGYIAGVDLYEGTLNYVFITGYDRPTSHISVKSADAAAIFADGTMKEITVNVTDTDANITSFKAATNTNADANQKALYANWSTGGAEQHNRWYTYTVDANGTYTLKPVARQIVTNVTGDGNPNTVDRIIDCSNVYLDGTLHSTARAYGNDNSVYITTETGAVDAGTQYAITDVSGVYTGVQDVEIEVNDDTNLTEGEIYTIYDKDLYVIASVVVGEARGNVTNYAYILSGATSERYESSEDMYYWTFDAVLNGEKVELTAQSKYRSTITALVPGTVQELRFTGDYVTKVVTKPVDVSAPNQVINAGSDEIYHITGIDQATLYLEGRTLHLKSITMNGGTTYANSTGLTFTTDAKAVVKQPINGSTVTTSYNTVAEAVSALGDEYPNTDGKQFDGNIVAILNNQGVAEWIVFISDVDAGNQSQNPGGPDYGVDGRAMGPYSTVSDVNAALKEGNVVITGTWQPASGGVVNIPANTTLKVDGDLDAVTEGLTINASNNTSKLVVTGNYEAPIGNNVNYNVTAESMTFRVGSATVNVTGDVEVEKDVALRGTSGKLVIAKGTKVTVGGDFAAYGYTTSGTGDAVAVEVKGILDVEGDINLNANLDIDTGAVVYADNIDITGTVTNNGHVEYTGTATVNGSVVDLSANSIVGPVLTINGTLTITGGRVDVPTVTATTINASSDSRMNVTTVTAGTMTIDDSVVNVATVKVNTINVQNGAALTVTSSVANQAGSGDANITVTGSGSTLDASKATSVDANISNNGGSVTTPDDENVVGSYDVTAALRGKGPGKAESGVANFDYGAAYAATGLSFDGKSTLTVDSATLNSFETGTMDNAESYGGNGNNTVLHHLYQESSAGGMRLYAGVAFKAPTNLSGATQVKVELNGKVLNNGTPFDLSEASVSGDGSDVFDSAYVQYLPYATYTVSDADKVTLGTVANSQYTFFFTWMDASGTILGTSACTINLVTK